MNRPETELLTLADWQAAYRAGARAAALLPARAQRVFAQSPAAAWIAHADVAAIAARAAELDDRAGTFADRAALLQALPLFGVPFVVKDNIDVEGWATTAACPAYARQPARSATVVRRLLDAGAVMLGKCNLDQFATGLVGTRSPYGAPASAWAADRISGGSSSGSAVLVARGDVPFSLGTDTAGSGRVPAGFNHIVGLKPTPGRVSTAGVLPACRSIDCVSVFALDVDDAATVLALIEGADADDDYSDFRPGRARFGAPLRVGIPTEPLLDPGYAAAWAQAGATLEALGARARAVDFAPLHDAARLLYDGPWVAERYAVVQDLLDTQPEVFDPSVAEVIGRARGMTAVDTFRGHYRLRHIRQAMQPLWQGVDLLMVPTAPRHPRFDDVRADPIGANSVLGTYTNFVNLLGWSALALPAGLSDEGLPFGVTFIAPGHADAALVHWGRRWQGAVAQPLGATGRRVASAPGLRDGELATDVPATARAPATEPVLPLAVVGAHLNGLPLNSQLTERGAVLRERTSTAPNYRLHVLPGTQPPKPGLRRVNEGGRAIELEVWDLPAAQVGSFLALIPAPLGLGQVELADGRRVHGFLCEAHALDDAPDISAHGGWRAFLASL